MSNRLVLRPDNLERAMRAEHRGITQGNKKCPGKEVDHDDNIPLPFVLLTRKKAHFSLGLFISLLVLISICILF